MLLANSYVGYLYSTNQYYHSMKDLTNVIEIAKQSVLCWLATVDTNGMPNVSPKEVFTFVDRKLVIANIMSPQSSSNIKNSEMVCVSFINVMTEYGYQIKGKAKIIGKSSNKSQPYIHAINTMTNGKYPYQEIFVIQILNIKEVKAPSYIFYPEKTIEERLQTNQKRYLAI